MKSLFAFAVISTLLAAAHSAGGGSSSSEHEPLTGNAEVSSSILKDYLIRPATVHFVDEKNYPNVYLANGVLVDMDKVLTNRYFLERYENNIEEEELYVYCAKRQYRHDIIKVKRVEINKENNGRLAIAHLEKNIVRRFGKIDCCPIGSHPIGRITGDIRMTVSGWEFTGLYSDCKLKTITDLLSMIGPICESKRFQQKSFGGIIKVKDLIPFKTYIDTKSEVFIGEEGAPVIYYDTDKLFGIVCAEEKIVVGIHSEIDFLIRAGVQQLQSNSSPSMEN